MDRSKAKRLTICAILISMALVLSYMERFIPLQLVIPLPGIKLGIANIVTVVALYCFEEKICLCDFDLKVSVGFHVWRRDFRAGIFPHRGIVRHDHHEYFQTTTDIFGLWSQYPGSGSPQCGTGLCGGFSDEFRICHRILALSVDRIPVYGNGNGCSLCRDLKSLSSQWTGSQLLKNCTCSEGTS